MAIDHGAGSRFMPLLAPDPDEPRADSWVGYTDCTARYNIRTVTGRTHDAVFVHVNILILIFVFIANFISLSDSTGRDAWEHEIWHKEADGHFSTEGRGLKLVVRKSDNCARYVVLQCAGHDGSSAVVMLSSGTEPSVDAAIAAARRAAKRIDIMLAERRRVSCYVDLRPVRADAHAAEG